MANGAISESEQGNDGDPDEEDDESRSERINRELIELINELRVALVGVQVLFAFLLAVPFSQGFAKVTDFQKGLFFTVLCSTAIASALMVAPSAYHRINFRSKDKEQMLRTSNGLMIGGLVFIAVSIIGAVVLVADFIYHSTATTVACAVIGAALFAGLWFVLPVVRRDPEQTPD
jgi:predicted membrane channel-forming protein YqfA (hemolysin III family)